ncbi:HpcH/HpaI aldolase/citrate lyase family protein [Streptomyces sp. NPDC057433]|uniref:HpcH/HpaI aldolase/citrate lyase family protein n=1 Tax=Streptomyces sp. NPDC057433 TaxID=3346132 RepID=UPI00369CE844
MPRAPRTGTRRAARPGLYAPGDRPRGVAKALGRGADVVVIGLEDAVAPDRKAYARAATAELLRDPQPVPVHVRVNAPACPWGGADLAAVAPAVAPAGLRLPKVSSPADVVRVTRRTVSADGGGLALYAPLETALGIERAHDVATAHPSLRGIPTGEEDLRTGLGVPEDAGLDWSRSRVVVAARAAGLAPPAESVRPDIRDLDGLRASCARAPGFPGRAAVHPRQLPVIERARLPTEEEIERAETVVKAAAGEKGAQALSDGRFTDTAVVTAARRVLCPARRV